jgi:hypothetical protein
MKSERTDHWTKMRPSRAPSSGPAASCHMLSSVDFITTTFESEFLVHTRALDPEILQSQLKKPPEKDSRSVA